MLGSRFTIGCLLSNPIRHQRSFFYICSVLYIILLFCGFLKERNEKERIIIWSILRLARASWLVVVIFSIFYYIELGCAVPCIRHRARGDQEDEEAASSAIRYVAGTGFISLLFFVHLFHHLLLACRKGTTSFKCSNAPWMVAQVWVWQSPSKVE